MTKGRRVSVHESHRDILPLSQKESYARRQLLSFCAGTVFLQMYTEAKEDGADFPLRKAALRCIGRYIARGKLFYICAFISDSHVCLCFRSTLHREMRIV